MPQPTATVVLTTISDPVLLDDYFENFRTFGHLDSVRVIVIPDRKTPPAAFERCQQLARKGLRIRCPDIEKQETFLTSTGLPPAAVPYNSDNRRNVGFLMAYASGSEFLISIDDDNYCRPDEDFFAAHAAVVGPDSIHNVVESAAGFLNICDLLEFHRPGPVYPRGYPYRFRHIDESWRWSERRASVPINAGLWLLDPDIDAITWLVAKPRVIGFKGDSVVLGPQTWTPVNTQNTALIRDAIPAYYFFRMGYPISGMPVDRYGDIFSGYFAQACVKSMGGLVRVGTPIADHRRNTHNYMKDATNEWACILTLEDLLPWLLEFRPGGASYMDCYRALSYGMEDAVERFAGSTWTDVTRGYFHQVAYYMRLWLEACRNIDGGRNQ